MVETAILSATAEIVCHELGSRVKAVSIAHAAIGMFLTGVRLSSGHAGACSSAVSGASAAEKAAALAISDRMQGRSVRGILENLPAARGVERAVSIAALNALAQMAAQGRARDRISHGEEIDALAAVGVQPQETVVVVGAFVPFLRKLRNSGTKYIVLERDPTLLRAADRANFRDAGQAAKVVPSADVLIITGAALVNETLGELVALARPQSRIAVVGPSVPIIPDAFFEHGIDIVGSVRVTDADEFMNVIARGGRGYHLFGKSAVKVAMRNRLSSRLFERLGTPVPSLSRPAEMRSATT